MIMTAALLPLLAAIPIAAAAATVLWRNPVWQRAWLLGIPVLTGLAGLDLLGQHRDTPVLAENVGAFVPGVAIPFVSDTFSALMILVTSFTVLMCLVFMVITREDRYRLLTPLVLMLIGGVNGAFLTGDLFNLVVFVEVMLLPSYALIATISLCGILAVVSARADGILPSKLQLYPQTSGETWVKIHPMIVNFVNEDALDVLIENTTDESLDDVKDSQESNINESSKLQSVTASDAE